MRTSSCGKCGGTMTEGYAVTDHQGSKSPLRWTEGAIDRRWWGLKLKSKPVEVSASKCRRCGFLEFYAPV